MLPCSSASFRSVVSVVVIISLTFFVLREPLRAADDPPSAQRPSLLEEVGRRAAVEAGVQLAAFASQKFYAWTFDKITGQSDDLGRAERDKQINYLISRDKEHEKNYQRLIQVNKLNVTRAEFESAMLQVLQEINPKLAEHTREIRRLQEMTETHQRLINSLQEDAGYLRLAQEAQRRALEAQRKEYTEGFDRQSARMSAVESEFEELRKDYPRWAPEMQGEYLASSGTTFMRNGDRKEAMRAFRFAHAYDPEHPGYLYMLAVLHRQDGQKEFAEMLLARAVTAERHRTLQGSPWWRYTVDRFQGPDRDWVEEARKDAIYGVFVPGTIIVPDPTIKR